MNITFLGIDNGHGFGDCGAVENGFREDLKAREIGAELEKLCKQYNKKYMILDKENNLSGRVNRANSNKVDCYLSLHLNSAGATATGTETLIHARGGNAEKIAKPVQDKVANALGLTNRGVRVAKEYLKKDLYVLKNTTMPAILIECCFISNKSDMQKFNARKIAVAIFEGLYNIRVEEQQKPSITPSNPSTTNVYRIFTEGQQQGTAYANIDYILSEVKKGLEKGLNKIELIKK